MRRFFAFASVAMGLAMALALAGPVTKFVFPDTTYPDGNMGTLRASSKITKKSTTTTCSYFSDPNEQYLGQFESLEFASADAATVLQFCLDNYDSRQ